MEQDNRVMKSYVWHDGSDKCFFVSTIERDYCTMQGLVRGEETIVWDYDYDKKERGDMIWQGGHICDHLAICRFLYLHGVIPDDEDEQFERFKK